MKILDLVPAGGVVDDLRSETKEGVLRELSEAVCRAVPALSPDHLASVLMDRESLGSTGIGEGVAIPTEKRRGSTGCTPPSGAVAAGCSSRPSTGSRRTFFSWWSPRTTTPRGCT